MALSQITFEFDAAPDKNEVKKNLPGLVKSKRGRKSLKEMGRDADLIEIPPDDILFQKHYYSIGDVAAMFKENTSLIRYWENEFSILKPKKNSKGDRFFRPEDIKNLKMIYYLLRERKYTIDGAKEFLKNNKAAGEKHEMIESLQKIKSFLLELKSNL
jgi:DNA-binding transcriptional MerR regulator